MAKVEMSIHRGLGELKTYDDRIANSIGKTFVIENRKSNDTIEGKGIEEIKDAIKGNRQSVVSLIENKKRIKSAIIYSNSVQKVKINNKEYTVSEAIERKNLIHLEEEFIRALKIQFRTANARVEYENSSLQAKLETYLQSVLGDKSNRDASEVEKHIILFEKRNKYELIDPLKISDYIETLEEEVLTFKNEVDYTLSESNSTTIIEVGLVN